MKQDSTGATQNDFTYKDLFDIVVGAASGSVLGTVLQAAAGGAIGAGIGIALGVSGTALAAGVATGGLIGTLEAAKASDLDDQRQTKPANTSQALKELFNKNPLLDDPDWYGQNTPFVLTSDLLQTSPTTVTVDGVVLTVGSSAINAQGICWSKKPQTAPSVNDHVIHALPTVGGYQVTVGNLEADSMYYFRAFAENNAGVAYGDVIGYKMPKAIDTLKMINSHGPWNAYFLGGPNNTDILGVTFQNFGSPECPGLVTSEHRTDNFSLAFGPDFTGTEVIDGYDMFYSVISFGDCSASGPVINAALSSSYRWQYLHATQIIQATLIDENGVETGDVIEFHIASISDMEMTGTYNKIEDGEIVGSSFMKLR